MKAQDLFTSMRFLLDDMQGNKYSDYILSESVNSVLSIVNNALSNVSSEILTNEATIPLIDGVTDLPADYQAIVNVFAGNNCLTYQSKSLPVDSYTYRIRNNKLYSANDNVTVHYKRTLTRIDASNLTTDLPLPDYFAELLKKYAIAMLTGGISKGDAPITQQVTADTYKLTSGREYNSVEFTPSFTI